MRGRARRSAGAEPTTYEKMLSRVSRVRMSRAHMSAAEPATLPEQSSQPAQVLLNRMCERSSHQRSSASRSAIAELAACGNNACPSACCPVQSTKLA